ncbi:MAG: DedA family protein [Patescibacteria group bacterium]|mgnify:CR=1 FL=1
METFFNFFQSNFPALIEHKYLFLFLGAAIEGMNIIILAGFLASMGSIALFPMFLLSVLGATINGYIWYVVGYFAGAKPIDKWGRKDPKSRRIIEKVEEYFGKYSGRAIVFTKMTWSLTIATLIMAGSFKYDLKKFGWYNFVGSVGWAAITFFVGYFFGQSYKWFLAYLANMFYVLAFLGGAIAIVYFIKIFFRSAFIRSLFLADRIREFSSKMKNGIDKFLSDRE